MPQFAVRIICIGFWIRQYVTTNNVLSVVCEYIVLPATLATRIIDVSACSSFEHLLLLLFWTFIIISAHCFDEFQWKKDARVLSLQSLPIRTQVLAFSGTKDDFINSDTNVPNQLPSRNLRAVWDLTNDALSCVDDRLFH